MFVPTKFQTIKQPPKSSVCGACVCAMAIGKTLEEVLAEIDWRHLAYTSGMAAYLGKYGISLGIWFPTIDPSQGVFTTEIDPKDRPAIVAVKSGVFKDSDHWIFWDGERYRDPSPREQERYEVLETHFLSYWPGEPAWIGRLPVDGLAPRDRELIGRHAVPGDGI